MHKFKLKRLTFTAILAVIVFVVGGVVDCFQSSTLS